MILGFQEKLCLIVAVVDLILGIIGVTLNVGHIADLTKDCTDEGFISPKVIKVQFAIHISTVVCTVILVASCLQIILSSVLIYGIRKRSNTLLTVWMIFKVIFIVVIGTMFISSYYFFGITPVQSLHFLVFQGNTILCVQMIQDLKDQNKSQMEADNLTKSKVQNNGIQIQNNECNNLSINTP